MVCIPSGMQTSLPLWAAFGPSSGRSGTTSSGRRSVTAQPTCGRVGAEGTSYRYSCTGSRLTHFSPGQVRAPARVSVAQLG
ncbi:MAG TPA: hypothetical protein VNH20_05680 [Candidatus Dormibacteraeota bacterium]|nr:hypothetical protein [Candidatus Dormibacteraeota bacterium]